MKISVSYTFRSLIALNGTVQQLPLARHFSTTKLHLSSLHVFDRETKRQQRNWAAQQPDLKSYQYLKDEIGYRVADRVYDITHFFDLAVDLGSGLGHIAPHVFKVHRLLADEELVPFRTESVDLIISSLSIHWINNLPNFFKRCFRVLRPDGAFIGAMFGGHTLFELRCSLQLAEQERKGGLSPHVSPFVKVEDVTSLLNRSGFQMVTLDTDQLVVGFTNPFSLLYDLQRMAESNAAYKRPLHLGREVLKATGAVYKEMYGREDGKFPATFEIINMIGWKPGPKMPKPSKPAKPEVSFRDIGSISSPHSSHR